MSLNIDGKDIVKLAASFTAGGITAEAISEHYGDGVLGAVMGLIGGGMVTNATGSVLDIVDRETGIVSGLGGLVDDVFSIF